MRFNYQIIIEYLGKNFVGWQIQKNGNSIQAIVEKALTKTLRSKTKINGSGRTDSGVNAWAQSANFFSNNEIKNTFKFLSTINFYLKNFQISVINIKKKNIKFHARHSAKKRTYKYLIINRFSSLVLDRTKAWHVKKKLNIKIMKKGAKLLIGTHNFSTFRSSSCQSKSPIKTLKKAQIKKEKNKIIFTFESKSFLQHQVRSMVGSIKYLGEGRWNLKDFKKVFKSKKRSMCAPPAPAHGLYLYEVKY